MRLFFYQMKYNCYRLIVFSELFRSSLQHLTIVSFSFSEVVMCEIQWFPALEEYDPGITTDNWLELLTDKSIIGGDYVWARVLAVFYAENGDAVPSVLNRKYGYNGSLLRY